MLDDGLELLHHGHHEWSLEHPAPASGGPIARLAAYDPYWLAADAVVAHLVPVPVVSAIESRFPTAS